MKFSSARYILIILLLLEAVVSCESNDGLDLSDSPEIITRTDEPGTTERTYRILTYDSSRKFKDDATGTYIGVPGQVMTPHVLDADGVKVDTATIEENKAAAISGVSDSRYVVCVSPGKKNNEDGSIDIYANLGGPIYISDPEKQITLGSMVKHDFGKIKDRRARINFKIAIDPANTGVNSINVSQIALMGVGGIGYDGVRRPSVYYPMTRQVQQTMNSHVTGMKDSYEKGIQGKCFESIVKSYVPSAIYAPKDIVRQKLKLSSNTDAYLIDSNYLYAVFDLTQDNNDPVRIIQVLTDNVNELEPMCEYTFTFLIKSKHYSLTLDKQDYGDSGREWIVNEYAPQSIGSSGTDVSIDLGTWPIGGDSGQEWEEHNPGNQRI